MYFDIIYYNIKKDIPKSLYYCKMSADNGHHGSQYEYYLNTHDMSY
jgi:hypothetical protein